MSGEELRALAQAATPGEWTAVHSAYSWVSAEPSHRPPVAGIARPADAAFIAAANPTTVLALLDRVEEAEDERDRLAEGWDASIEREKTLEAEVNALRAVVERVRALAHEWDEGRWFGALEVRAALKGPQ